MMKRWLSLLILLLWTVCAWSADKPLRLAVPPDGFPPYIILGQGKQVSGIIVDVLREAAARQGYQLVATEAPKKRVEPMILSNKLDAAPRAIEWGGNSHQFLFTDSIVRVRDLVFSRKDAPLRYQSPDDLRGKRLGTHLGYNYPVLTPYFDAKEIVREDARTEESMLRMLQVKRTDAVVMNEMVALWLIKADNLGGQFVASETELGGYEYRLMFGPQWSPFVVQFNRELSQMKKDGRLARVIDKYRLKAE